MNFPPYPFVTLDSSEDVVIYSFVSVSPEKTIQKLIFFTRSESGIYNMALVDLLESGELSDMSISNNQDMEIVLATVIRVLSDFLNRKSDAIVTFQGSTPERTRLYRIVISKFLPEIIFIFDVGGLTLSGEYEPFRPNQNYTGFVVSLKALNQ
ncbi:DUF6934 family protein [Spirosoma jeollabukense]